MALIELKNICKSYPLEGLNLKILKGINLQIESGEFVAIMGPSGSGKSTLMNILGSLDKPTSGHYQLDGKNVEKLSSDELAEIRNQKIGFVFQGFNLLARTSALESVELPLLYRGVPAKERHEAAMAAVDRVGLMPWAHHTPSELSGGQQTREALSRAIVTHPLLLLADEPTGSLDSKRSVEIMELLTDLNKSENITVVLVTHEPDMAMYARRCIHFLDGLVASDEIQPGR